MKKTFIILIFMLLSLTFIKAQNIDIPETQNPVIIKITATWCPNCGSWGWTFFHDLIEDNESKSTIFAAHPSGNYKNTTAVDLVNNFNTVGQPRFLFNGEDQFVGSNSTGSKRSSFSTKVNDFSKLSPSVQTGIEATYNGSTMHVNYETKFFTSTSGEYYLSIYLIEKEVIGYQAAQGNNAKHKKILREELTNHSFGNLITSGSIASGITFGGKVDFDISKYDPKNLEIVSVIWKKEGDTYKIINSNIDKEVSLNSTSSTKIQKKQPVLGFNVFPTIVQDRATIELELSENAQNSFLTLYNYDGKVLRKTNLDQLKRGNNRITFQVPSNISNGFYYLRISTQKGKSFTKKIIISKK